MQLPSRIAAVLLMSLMSYGSLSVAQEADSAELSAIDTVKRYMGALIYGNTTQLRTLLAPNLVKERQALLDNPNYPQALQVAYANATFDITGSQRVDSEKVRVDARIVLNESDIVHSRFILVRINDDYRIIAEE